MKKAVIRIGLEYDHSYMFNDIQVIDAIEGIGSNIVTLINKPGSPLWLNFGAQATVMAVGSNVYVDKVDMPLFDEFDTVSKEYIKQQVGIISDCADVAAKTKANELDERIKAYVGLTSNVSPQRKGDILDRYAIPAMQAIISTDPSDGTPFRIAAASYIIAEAMIKERNKRTQ